jgi:hypothetical protein
VREALIWLGEADPVDTMEELRAEDPGRQHRDAVFAAWTELPEFDLSTGYPVDTPSPRWPHGYEDILDGIARTGRLAEACGEGVAAWSGDSYEAFARRRHAEGVTFLSWEELLRREAEARLQGRAEAERPKWHAEEAQREADTRARQQAKQAETDRLWAAVGGTPRRCAGCARGRPAGTARHDLLPGGLGSDRSLNLADGGRAVGGRVDVEQTELRGLLMQLPLARLGHRLVEGRFGTPYVHDLTPIFNCNRASKPWYNHFRR